MCQFDAVNGLAIILQLQRSYQYCHRVNPQVLQPFQEHIGSFPLPPLSYVFILRRHFKQSSLLQIGPPPCEENVKGFRLLVL